VSCAASALYDSYAVSGDRYRPLSSSHWSSLWSSAGLTTAKFAGWATCHLISRVKTLQHSWVLAFTVLNTTDILASLHRLDIPENILFKVAVLTYRTVNDSAPVYLSSYFTRVADVLSRLRLRSSISDQTIVPSYNLASVGRRAFPVLAAFLWNSYTAHLTSAPSLTVFWQRLKTFLFRRSYADLMTLQAYILLWT